jgi:hypothetical protein
MQTADLVEAVACLALRARLKECRKVACTVSCDATSLLAGRINSVKVTGEGWASPGNLTARILECTVSGRRPPPCSPHTLPDQAAACRPPHAPRTAANVQLPSLPLPLPLPLPPPTSPPSPPLCIHRWARSC